MLRLLLLTWLMTAGCIDRKMELPVQAGSDPASGQEVIPAEWTVAEDTSETGEVTTSSVQLPAAREINGLLDSAAPRLVLRCLDRRVALFIDTQSEDAGASPEADIRSEPIRIDLEDAPPCE